MAEKIENGSERESGEEQGSSGRRSSRSSSGSGDKLFQYHGWVYHLGTNSIGHEFCHLRFLWLKGKYAFMYKRDPFENPTPVYHPIPFPVLWLCRRSLFRQRTKHVARRIHGGADVGVWESSVTSSINALFLLFSAYLVFVMQLGFAMLCAGTQILSSKPDIKSQIGSLASLQPELSHGVVLIRHGLMKWSGL
ncbi:Ammonium transporter 1 member 3 [Nymphaea thermarum]|nr:Ammonium transporter 1 member 3 [Nymphaea thermarum]